MFLMLIGLVLGIGVFFYIRSILLEAGYNWLVPYFAVGIFVSFLVGATLAQLKDKLFSVAAIRCTCSFIKKTQWYWFALLLITALVVGVYGA